MVPRDNAFVLLDSVLVLGVEIRPLASPKLEFKFHVYGFYGGLDESAGVI
jgi:hypothetical protein